MARLLNGLLDISRLESGTIEPQRREVDLVQLLTELRSEFESLARARNLKFEVEPIEVVLAISSLLIFL